MKVALLQYDIAWEKPDKNFAKIESILANSDEKFDLLLLPEMFTTGFTMNTSGVFEEMDGSSISRMRALSSKYQCAISGSLIIKESDEFYNRLIWISKDGDLYQYDKKHLFTLAKEDRHFSPGRDRLLIEMSVNDEMWKICPLICYDLRFPVWSRNTEEYDLLIYVANFPQKRAFAWSQLLIARAIENQSYTIGVNRIGEDGIGIPYSGDSVVIDYQGKAMLEAKSEEGLFIVELMKDKQNVFRRAYNFLRDRDNFEFK